MGSFRGIFWLLIIGAIFLWIVRRARGRGGGGGGGCGGGGHSHGGDSTKAPALAEGHEEHEGHEGHNEAEGGKKKGCS